MAPYKDTKSLFDLASQSLGNYIGSVTVSVLKKFDEQTENKNAEESRNLQEFIKKTVEHYDTHIPPSFHNIVTFYSLMHIVSYFKTNSLHSFDIATTGILDIAVRAHITKLNFSEWPSYVKQYLCKSLHRMKKLKLLNFYEGYLCSIESEIILKSIQGMKNLQSFVHYYCDDTMLEMLSNNCCLKNLDIAYSFAASNSSVSSILKMQSLKTLSLPDQFSIESCKCIILGLPNLIYIKYDRLNEVLAQITENVVLPLQYVEYNCYYQKDVTSLINLCPSIKKLYISDYSYAVDFSDLVALQNLTSLAVENCVGFYKSGIKLLLESRGYQITDLELRDIGEVSMKSLHEISTLCPKLNILVLNSLQVSEQPALPIENKILFPKLEYLYCDIGSNNSALLFLLHNCIKIKILKYVHFGGISDKDFLDVFSFNNLGHLEELTFYKDTLTLESIFKLISSCNNLKRIGPREFWDIRKSEIQELQQYIKENNLDIELFRISVEEYDEQNTVMKSLRHEFTVYTKFPRTTRPFFVVEENA